MTLYNFPDLEEVSDLEENNDMPIDDDCIEVLDKIDSRLKSAIKEFDTEIIVLKGESNPSTSRILKLKQLLIDIEQIVQGARHGKS